jgi:hypothetical protein
MPWQTVTKNQVHRSMKEDAMKRKLKKLSEIIKWFEKRGFKFDVYRMNTADIYIYLRYNDLCVFGNAIEIEKAGTLYYCVERDMHIHPDWLEPEKLTYEETINGWFKKKNELNPFWFRITRVRQHNETGEILYCCPEDDWVYKETLLKHFEYSPNPKLLD